MKLHIFGASGSGVTTLGTHLSKLLNLPYFDSDNYFWEKTDMPFTMKRNPEIRNQIIKNDLNVHESWILGGSIINWGNGVFPDFDLIVFLWVEPDIRSQRLRNREFERYGDLIYYDDDRKNKYQTFINWAADYDKCSGIANRNVKSHENWLQKINVPILRLNNLSVEERAELVLNAIGTN